MEKCKQEPYVCWDKESQNIIMPEYADSEKIQFQEIIATNSTLYTNFISIFYCYNSYDNILSESHTWYYVTHLLFRYRKSLVIQLYGRLLQPDNSQEFEISRQTTWLCSITANTSATLFSGLFTNIRSKDKHTANLHGNNCAEHTTNKLNKKKIITIAMLKI